MKTAHKKLLLAGLIMAACVSAKTVQATEYFDVEADNSTLKEGGKIIESNGPLHHGPASWSTTPDFSFAVKHGVGVNVFYPDITTKEAYPGHKSSFELIMNPRIGSGSPGEKMLADMVVGRSKESGENSYATLPGVTKTLAFALKLAPDFTMSDTHLMFWEWYQEGSPTGAVIDMALKPGTLTWQIVVHLPLTPAGEKPPPNVTVGPKFDTVILPGATIEKDKWYYFAFTITPNYAKNGEITGWQNGKQILHSNSCEIGFDPTKPLEPGGKGHPNKSMNVCVGVYRAASHVDKAHIYMDMIRWGDTYADIHDPSVKPSGVASDTH